MRCIDCKKEIKEMNSIWDRFRLFLFHFFHEDITDLREEYFTKGYGEGYAQGMKLGVETKMKTKTLEEIISEVNKWSVKSNEKPTN